MSNIGEPDKKGRAFYKKKICYTYGSSKFFLVFCAVDYYCKVFINDELVKEHKGGYAPFDIDVTSYWHNDRENVIVVEACDDDYEYQTYGKQSYGNVRGIWQDVYLEERAESFIDKFRIVTKIDGSVEVNANIIGEFQKIALKIGTKVFESKDSYLKFKINNPIL